MCNHDSAFNIVRTKDNHMITDVICADCNESLMEIIAAQKDKIEQQATQIKAMRNCYNCKYRHGDNCPCDDYSKWEIRAKL